MKYTFYHGTELTDLCKKEQVPISEIMLRYEMERSEMSRETILAQLKDHLDVMKESIRRGLDPEHTARGFFSGGDAMKLLGHARKSHMGCDMADIIAASMAVVEVNASMGRIVAAPTAGASGILPAVLIICGERQKYTEDQLLEGLLNAGAIGRIIAANASIAGASGGCQAETGSAAAMAASALAQLSGADPDTCLHAAAMALKNCMGLVCDPVGGLVECPCIKRNAIGAANAVISCDMALAGITSLIPFDEVVLAMKNVGLMMHPALRETAKGGIAATPTGKALAEKLGGRL